MKMGERIKDNFNRYSISGPTFVASGILFREQVFAQFLSSFSVQAKKKSCVFFLFFFNSNVYVWFSLCFNSPILYP